MHSRLIGELVFFGVAFWRGPECLEKHFKFYEKIFRKMKKKAASIEAAFCFHQIDCILSKDINLV